MGSPVKDPIIQRVREEKEMMSKHIITMVKPNLKRAVQDINCRECATSCQSACKTSCTVGNQSCKKRN